MRSRTCSRGICAQVPSSDSSRPGRGSRSRVAKELRPRVGGSHFVCGGVQPRSGSRFSTPISSYTASSATSRSGDPSLDGSTRIASSGRAGADAPWRTTSIGSLPMGARRAFARRVECRGGARADLHLPAPSAPERPRPNCAIRGWHTPENRRHRFEWSHRPYPLRRAQHRWPPCRSLGPESGNADVPRRALGSDRGHGRGRGAGGTRRGRTPGR